MDNQANATIDPIGHLQDLSDEADASTASNPNEDSLAELVAKFRAETEYPTPEDDAHKEKRTLFARVLAKDNLEPADLDTLRPIWNEGRGTYGTVGAPSHIRRYLPKDNPPEEHVNQMINTITYLCKGEGSDAERIDLVLLGTSEYNIPGFSHQLIMKLLAITRPNQYLPLYKFEQAKDAKKGNKPDESRSNALKLLNLPEPAGTEGAIWVESNRLLRTNLEPSFMDDLWGMRQFIFWLANKRHINLTSERNDPKPHKPRRDKESEAMNKLDDELRDLSTTLLLKPENWLLTIKDLLDDKHQVIFYGPPGTGKTRLARELAEKLAPNEERRRLVQFHPSTSYEDFFEGFRPKVKNGEMTYILTSGPLRRMAKQAWAGRMGSSFSNTSYDEKTEGLKDHYRENIAHVMVIDEINRANLPKVFGELLFLLEYRDQSLFPLYQPDEEFSLPPNLYFIGTMNTADRSVALVDAALRRRFHFVPFFPDEEPIKGLLHRWHEKLCEQKRTNLLVHKFVDMINDKLLEAGLDRNLLLGPTYFMQEKLTEKSLQRIWKYSIEPLIEEHFFGNNNRVEEFHFDKVQTYLEVRTESQESLEDANTANSEPNRGQLRGDNEEN